MFAADRTMFMLVTGLIAGVLGLAGAALIVYLLFFRGGGRH
jgi:hypothetical protein